MCNAHCSISGLSTLVVQDIYLICTVLQEELRNQLHSATAARRLIIYQSRVVDSRNTKKAQISNNQDEHNIHVFSRSGFEQSHVWLRTGWANHTWVYPSPPVSPQPLC